MKEPNIGETGAESIRINGRRIENLPLGQGNQVKEGLREFLKTDKETKENNIIAKFPKHKRPYLEAQIRECRRNINQIKNFKRDLKNNIVEYRQLIKDCQKRDEEIAKCDPIEDKDRINKLKREIPPYNVEAMYKQIEQFEEGIDKCDETIEQDYDSISEITSILALVEQKEKELKNIK